VGGDRLRGAKTLAHTVSRLAARDNQDRPRRLVRDETGKSWGDLSMGEVAVAVDVLNYYADHGEEFLASRSPRARTASR
jgi:hypothetical protein